VFLGSSCIYPKNAPQPIPESALLTGPLEETNEGYALAKIVGIKLVHYYGDRWRDDRSRMICHSLMPCNLYGPGDNYHPDNSHVLAAMIRRFHRAKETGQRHVVIWGTGTPLREFMHVDDLADAVLHASALPTLEDATWPISWEYDKANPWLNVGTGEEVSILDLARLVAKVVGYDGIIATDPSKPDGVKQKLVNSTRFLMTETKDRNNWRPQWKLEDGVTQAYEAYRQELETGTARYR
jgi:GDP-L-fucose synthase